MFHTPPSALLCVVAASLLGAVGQYLFKAASGRVEAGWLAYLTSPWVLSGMACYLAVMVLFTYAFRSGGTVAVLYPIYAMTFIWAAVIGCLLYAQPIRPIHLLGMVLLVVGMGCMGWGQSEPAAARVAATVATEAAATATIAAETGR